MPTNATAYGFLGEAPAPEPRAAAPTTMWSRKTGRHQWWRFLAQPSVLIGTFLILAAVSVGSIYLSVSSQSASQWVAHTLGVELKLATLRTLVRRAESSQRGFLLTNDAKFLEAYQSGVDATPQTIANLSAAIADNPVQQRALARLAPMIAQKLTDLHETLLLYAAGDPAGAFSRVRTGRGRVLMDDIHNAVESMMAEESHLLDARVAKSRQTNHFLLVTNFIDTALIIAFAVVSIVVVRKLAEEALHNSEQRGNELQAAVNELEAFSYSVSHDLRAPLRAIDAFNGIVLKQYAAALDPEAREHLKSVRDNAVQMGHLVDDLLAFSRLGRKAIQKQQVTTSAIVEQVLHDARQRSEGRRVNVSVGNLPSIFGDPSLLKQVFVNLIDNAFKYTRMREEATIEIGSQDIGGEQIYFVRDNGAGFDMQYADKLFGVFQRLHRAEDFEGTGVGLAIVQRIINRHGGRIWAEAEVDHGATFFFTMETPNVVRKTG